MDGGDFVDMSSMLEVVIEETVSSGVDKNTFKDMIWHLEKLCSENTGEEEKEERDMETTEKLLDPSSTWSVLMQLPDLVAVTSRALERCGHSLQVLRYSSTQLAVYCLTCKHLEGEKNVASPGKEQEKTAEEEEVGEVRRSVDRRPNLNRC